MGFRIFVYFDTEKWLISNLKQFLGRFQPPPREVKSHLEAQLQPSDGNPQHQNWEYSDLLLHLQKSATNRPVKQELVQPMYLSYQNMSPVVSVKCKIYF